MKRKYYLRGIGVGILFATIVLFTANSISGGKELSDEEIMQRAEELGMVKSESVLEHLTKPADDTATEQNTDNSGADASTADSIDDDRTVSGTEDASEEATTERSENGRTVTITVENGMSALDVGELLQEKGVIEDSRDFANYMMKNGYSYKVLIGEYTIAVDADYETIANILMGK